MRTPVWLALAALSRFRTHEAQKEQREYERWRMLGFWTLRPHQKKNAVFEPQMLVTFPWEEQPQDISRARAMVDRLVKEGKIKKAPKG